MLVWLIGERFLFPRRPAAPVSSDQTTSTQPVSAPAPGANAESAPAAASPAGVPAGESGAGGYTVAEAAATETLALGADAQVHDEHDAKLSPYRMRLLLSNVGASVESALLTDHAETLRQPARYALLGPATGATGAVYRSLAIEKLNIDDTDLALAEKRWNVVPPGVTEYTEGEESGQQAAFYLDVTRAGAAVVRLTRTFRLPEQPAELGRHDLYAMIAVENVSAEPHRVLVTYRGGLGVRSANPSRDDRVVDVGVRSADGLVAGRRWTFHDVAGKQAATVSPSETAARLSWAATANTYFTCILAPVDANLRDPAAWLGQALAVDLDGAPHTLEDVTVRFSARAELLAAGQSVSYRTDVYAGENDGEAFRRLEPYRSRNYYYQIAQGFGWCTFTFLVEFMIWLMNRTFSLVPNYGVSIILLVLLVRTLLHPITKKGQVNMVRMQAQMGELSPKMEEVKKKYANDKARMQQEIMRVYRESGVSPGGQVLTCLPMFIQMPIWVALYLSLSYNIRMRHEPFILWIRDLTAPDALYTFASPLVVPLLGWTIPSLNLLPILVAVSMYLQTKFQPKPKPNPNMSEEQRMQQEMMQKMMPMMSIMFLFIFYKMPSGLTLYITASNFLGMLEQWHIRKHIRERENDGTLLKPARKPPPPPTNGTTGAKVPGWVEWLQKKAEEAQKGSRTQRATKPRR